MDAIDRAILNCLQYDFPLTTRPFSTIAKRLGLSTQTVIDRIAGLKKQNVVRQISPIFDSSKIGYQSVLVAFSVPQKRLDVVAKQLNDLAAVSHNYVRTNKFNLWFTLTIPKTSDLKKEATRLAKSAGVKDWLFLPTTKKFKISFQLDMEGKKQSSKVSPVKKTEPKASRPIVPNIPFIRELQKDISLTMNPFREAAQKLGLTEGKIVSELKRYIKAGAIRRIASVLKPVQAGFSTNVLTVWAPRPDQVDFLGRVAAGQKQVSHCYERPTFPKWPYSVYAMIHGRSRAECQRIIRAIERESGVTKHQELTTIKEYKKIRVEYYPKA